MSIVAKRLYAYAYRVVCLCRVRFSFFSTMAGKNVSEMTYFCRAGRKTLSCCVTVILPVSVTVEARRLSYTTPSRLVFVYRLVAATCHGCRHTDVALVVTDAGDIRTPDCDPRRKLALTKLMCVSNGTFCALRQLAT